MRRRLLHGDGGDGLRMDEWPSDEDSTSDDDAGEYGEESDRARGGDGADDDALDKASRVVAPSSSSGSWRPASRQLPSRLGFRVFVVVDDEVFDIAVGDGQQSAKWLAHVAYNRYKASKRTPANHATNAFLGNKRPIRLTLCGDEIAPDCKLMSIADRLGCDADGVPIPGREAPPLVVELQEPARRRGEALTPGDAVQTTWEASAYNFSEHGKRRTCKLLRLQAERVAAAKAIADERTAAEEAIKATAFEKLMVVDLEDPESVERALAGEWTHVRIDQLCRSEGEKEGVKRLFLEHFVVISDIFKHFAGGSADGGTDEISSLEFLQFALSLPGGMCELARDAGQISQIFGDSNAGRASDVDDNENALTRFEFMEALLRMALWKFGHMPGQLRVAGRMNALGALKTLLEEYVLPGAKEVGVGNFREAMRDPSVRAAFARKMGLLRAVFDTFCRADVEETKPSAFGGAGRPGGGSLVRSATMKANRGLAPNAKTMNLEEFARVIRESKLQKARDGAQLSNQDVRRVFAASQSDEATSDGLSDTDTEGGSDAGDSSQELVLGEFIDAIARISMLKYKDRADLEPYEMINAGISKLATLAPAHTFRKVATVKKATAIFSSRLASFRKATGKS